MLVTLSSVTKVWARTQHAPLYAVMRTAVRLHLRNQTMYLPTISFVSFRRTFMGIIYHLQMYVLFSEKKVNVCTYIFSIILVLTYSGSFDQQELLIGPSVSLSLPGSGLV